MKVITAPFSHYIFSVKIILVNRSINPLYIGHTTIIPNFGSDISKLGGYDIIGDIHGYASILRQPFEMGYKRIEGVWSHPDRKVIFLGDFINRGPEIRETLLMVRAMVESGSALAILGNHEYAAILYHIKDDNGTFMSRHIAGNRTQIQKTLTVFKNFGEEWIEHLKWMRTLPFYLDLGAIRIAHAYWNEEEIAKLDKYLPKGRLKRKFIRDMHEKRPDMAIIVYKLLKRGLNSNAQRI